MSEFLILFIWCVALIGFGAYAGYWVGIRRPIQTSLNETVKAMSKPGYVVEAFAPGENAEVVELSDTIDNASQMHSTGCLNCKYAGRYLIPTPKDLTGF